MNNAYSTLQAFWRLRGRLALAVIVLSLILLAIATKQVSLGSNFAFFGMGLTFARPIFLAAGAIVLAALCVSWWAVLLRVQYLRKDLERLYRTLGYWDKGIANELTSAFHSATFYGALMAPYQSSRWRNGQGWFVKWYDTLVSRAVAVLLVGALPIVTEAVIFVRGVWQLLDLGYPHWIVPGLGWLQLWTAALPAICIIVTISALINYLRKKPNDA
jgi:hypothetical protein